MKRAKTRIAGTIVWVTSLLMLGPVVAARGQEELEGHRGFMAAKGRVTFRSYCSSCHGVEGTGNGNLAQYLTVSPADLTLLSRDNNGDFPAERVRQTIDGHQAVRGHGSREMPVWGEVFQDSLSEQAPTPEETGEERAGRKIAELVLYLETIQLKGDSAAQAEEPGER